MAGIECEFVEKPPKAVQSECPICLQVLREPYQATCCGKSFCKECIERVKTTNQPCPTCNATGSFNLFPNKGLQQSLNDFEVYCSHKSKGCEWRGELREFDKHLNSDPPADKSLEGCPFTVISCPLSHTGCEVKLPRRDVKIHVNDDLLSHVMKQTALVLTLMKDNKTLNEELQSLKGEKQQLEQNVTELKNEMKHLQVADQVMFKVCQQEEEIKQLKEAQRIASNTGHPIGPVEITMTYFQQHQDEDERWYSQPFYTHPHGYKMCLCVCPKGFGAGKGTHLGLTIHLMRGEFDDQLKWPFRGDIAYQLVDQEGDIYKKFMVAHFNDHTSDKYTKRVTEEQWNTSGQGYAKVLPLSRLQPKYLKNNCIKLRIIKVELPQ